MSISDLTPQADPLPPPSPGRAPGRVDGEIHSLYAIAAGLVVAATSWFLLKEFAALLRPLVLAIFLAYLVVPVHRWLTRRIPAKAAAAAIVVGTLVLLWGLAAMIYRSLVDLNADLPRLIDRARGALAAANAYGHARLPAGLLEAGGDDVGAPAWGPIRASVRALVADAAGLLVEASVVGIYLIFLLLELRRFPRRIRAGFEPGRAEAILGVVERVNAATARYLRAKTLASLAIGVPSTIVLWAFGVRYPLLCGVLLFLGNFIPYVGSLVALAFPLLLAFLDLQPAWKPCSVTLLLLVIQVVSGYVIEPILAGKAVDLSPLVTLLCLAFWSLCWGLTGMLLAVPLTAMLKIIGENLSYTRSLAVLMAEGDGAQG